MIQFVLLLIVLEAIAFWALKQNVASVAILSYTCVGIVLYYLFQTKTNVTIINATWQILNVLVISTIGILVLGDQVTNKQLLGLCLAVLAIYFINADVLQH